VKKARGIRLVGHVTSRKKWGSTYRILILKLERKKPVGTSWFRCGNHFKMVIKEIKYNAENWNQWRPLVNTVKETSLS
jgi:hypothetical protein